MNSYSKFLINLFVLFLGITLFTNSVSAVKANIDISETYYSYPISQGKYSIEVKGSIKISNPSLVSKIYEINLPLKLDSLIGINKVDKPDVPNRFDFDYNSIRAYLLEPEEEISTNYVIYGIVNYDLSEHTIKKGISVLEYYTENFNLYSNTIINVEKVQREGFFYNESQELVSSPAGNETRLVAATIRNPTDFDYYLKELSMYRTQSSNPMYGDADLITKFHNFSIDPFDYKELNFFDADSTENSVYWVSSHVTIDSFIKTNIRYKPSSGGGDGGDDGGGIYIPQNNIIVKKTTDKTLINAGEEFEVTVNVINVGASEINGLVLYDEIPPFHEIYDVSKGVKIINGTKLIFDIDYIEAYGEFEVKYTLVNKEDVKGITFLKPASVVYNEDTFYSEGVLIINDLLPNKKVFIQKEIDYIDDDFARITITVKNLGAITLRNILVSDFLDENSIVKDITQVFEERGVWNINILNSGEEWQVSYLIERNPQIETLPNLFGVDNSQVYGTLIFSEEVVTVFTQQPKTIEKVGMIVAVGLLIFYLLF